MTDPFWKWDPSDGGLASRCMLHMLSTPFPIMEYMDDMARWESLNGLGEVKRHDGFFEVERQNRFS